MKYIIRYGTHEVEFEGTPSEIMELKSSLDRTKELREAIKIAIENDNKKVSEKTIDVMNGKRAETLVGGEKIEREI